ncbi:hypothetical protein [Luteolibacter sp. LG18]|uniref:hypothetical protein n=1 Tax=Luteolibacter sp. LG18 TaxID=2819286 RepID=UPI002B2F6BC2|nr:hypothetical protein llg_37360 [Luteolibacter sp. LG18]
MNAEHRFDWPVCEEAEDFLLSHLGGFLARNTFARTLSERMRDETGTLLIDWVDHLVMDAGCEGDLERLGFLLDPSGETPDGDLTWQHPEAMLPRVVLRRGCGQAEELAIHVECIVDFLAIHGIPHPIEGDPLGRYRRALVSDEHEARFHVTERRGYRGFIPDTRANASELLHASELWRTRRRSYEDVAEGFHDALTLLDRLIAMVGRDLACHVVFDGERKFWQSRNRAARVQKARQDSLGLGWANHDHHTFRSSREGFIHLMAVMERLGFERRERFYAGEQAGWGAQIMEQPVEGIVVFCDVDLTPEETHIDFSRQPLAPADSLHTVGLWIGLHGESFLDAGMHHLECRFDYAMLREQLAGEGVNTMKPFSDFPFLKQAFTEGEHWPVDPGRARKLLDLGLIDGERYRIFLNEGAIGSHLENLQRKGGFKGFNQQSVSAILAATDPRLAR